MPASRPPTPLIEMARCSSTSPGLETPGPVLGLNRSPLWRLMDSVAEFVGEPASGWQVTEFTLAHHESQSAARFLTASPRLRELLQLAQRMALTDWPILIEGETGTGKEMIARLVHHWSQRGQGPFVPVNCAALPETLAESELFGHERGSYTGAANARPGYFEQAHGGTLVLDEVCESPRGLQGKLLRVLECGHLYRLGASRPRPVSVRVLALSNRPLEKLVQLGQFRADLFHRLSVLRLALPALRERAEDIPLLADYFLQLACEQLGRARLDWSARALAVLRSYSWPGNVRELRNVVFQAVLRTQGSDMRIEPQHLALNSPGGEVSSSGGAKFGQADAEGLTDETPPPALSSPQTGSGNTSGSRWTAPLNWPTLRLAEVERLAIAEALRRTGGHRRRAAQLLGISLRTLFNKVRRYHLVSCGDGI